MTEKTELAKIREAWVGWDDDFRYFTVCISFDFGGEMQAIAPCLGIRAMDHHQMAATLRFIADLHLYLSVDRLTKAVGRVLHVHSERGIITGISLPKFDPKPSRRRVDKEPFPERFMLKDYFG